MAMLERARLQHTEHAERSDLNDEAVEASQDGDAQGDENQVEVPNQGSEVDDDIMPDVVVRERGIPNNWNCPIRLQVPKLDLSSPSKINKLYYCIRLPDKQTHILDINNLEFEIAEQPESDIASAVARKDARGRRNLGGFSRFLVRAATLAAIGGCAGLAFFGSHSNPVIILAAILVAAQVVQFLLSIWDFAVSYK